MNFETIRLTKERSAVQQMVDDVTLDKWVGNDPTIHVREIAELVRRMVVTLESYLVAQEAQPVVVAEREVTARVHSYDTFWDWFKASWVPRKLWRYRWLKPESREHSVTVTVRAVTDVKVIYPKLKLAFDREMVMVKAGPVRWEETDDGVGR